MSILSLENEIKQIICTIRVHIYDDIKNFDVHQDVNINYDQLEIEMDNFPQIYHLWSMIYSEVKEQLDATILQIQKRRSTITKIILAENSKMRKTDINDVVECDEELIKLEAKKIIIEKQSRKLYYTLESLKMKNDNMRSLAGFKRNEIKGY